MFDKSHDLFPIKDQYVYLTHCGIAPLYANAFRRQHEVAEQHMRTGALIFREYDPILDRLREAAAAMMRVSPEDVAFVKNTTEGISLIAAGYDFQPGDEILSYVHEYPANHYPWRLQERRGVTLVLLPDQETVAASPVAWRFDDLTALVTPRTRMIAISHVQFASGFVADLAKLGEFCRARGIDLVVDVAQSLGCLPFYPEELGVAAAVASGWKWLLGPIGCGLLYVAPSLRAKISLSMVGAETMQQGVDYLDHTWAPHASAKRFEYSTAPITLAAALECCVREIALRYGLEAIEREIYRLQDVFLGTLDRNVARPVFESTTLRTPILSLIVPGGANAMRKRLQKENVICTERGGYLRIAPHFYNTEVEMERAARVINSAK